MITVPPTVAEAVTESAPETVPGFSVMLAMPFASVSAVPPAGNSVPKLVPCVANVTTTPGSATPLPFFSVALSTAGVVDETALVEPVSTRVAGLTTGVVVPPLVVVVELPEPPPPQAPSSAKSANRNNDENARDEWIFNMCSCCRWMTSTPIVASAVAAAVLDQAR